MQAPSPSEGPLGSSARRSSERSDVRASRIRFKGEDDPAASSHKFDGRAERRPKRRRRSNEAEDAAQSGCRSRRRHHSRRHHARRKGSMHDAMTGDDAESATADSEMAFRESLFDAMADDEGADFWAGVYGQPVHVYGDTKPGPDGELERMTEEEYVTHVRARMWEKTHQHIVEERARREEAARKRAEEKKEAKANGDRFQRQMEESLRRGAQRRTRKEWQAAYEAYDSAWKHLQDIRDGTRAGPVRIPWPVQTGRREDVTPAGVEEFLAETVEHAGYSGKKSSRLKMERVRWHPDKMQQRMGAAGLESDDLKTITAVFQVLDDLWSRSK